MNWPLLLHQQASGLISVVHVLRKWIQRGDVPRLNHPVDSILILWQLVGDIHVEPVREVPGTKHCEEYRIRYDFRA